MRQVIEIWSDSFHEGAWCCDSIADLAAEHGCAVRKGYLNGFQPRYAIARDGHELELVVYGSYRSWHPLPGKIKDLIHWGKPDFIAYDPTRDEILFAVEETAATPTGNQPIQRCERQYGSARFRIPYWYLVSEYGMHGDGGVRRDSIWPAIAAIKLTMLKATPCVVLHYSTLRSPEDYASGTGVELLFRGLFRILENRMLGRDILFGLQPLLQMQYGEMLRFIASQWRHIIDFLPGEALIALPETADILAAVAAGDTSRAWRIAGLLAWPTIPHVPAHVRDGWTKKPLLKHDPLCALMEQDIEDGKAYYLSDNAGSGRPPTTAQIREWIRQQEQLFSASEPLTPPAAFTMKPEDFPETYDGSGHHHLTTAKNIVYLYDSWNDYVDTVVKAYPRLQGRLEKRIMDRPVFVYVSNSLKPGRLFGDPFTGQLTAYAMAFGRFDRQPRMVVAYFPHQAHTQAIREGKAAGNKGITIMTELTDYLLFHGGVAVALSSKEVL